MLDGFYTVRFATPYGAGGGVAYFNSNEILGGDSGFTYVGTYQMQGSILDANLRITPHFAGVATVFGSANQPFDLRVKGTASGTQIIGDGDASIAPGVKLQVQLQKVK